MVFLKTDNFKGIRTKGIIAVIVIAAVSYCLFFYLQNLTESNIRNSLFAQQEQRQLDSTKAISNHINSDFDSIISRLQGLANSIYLQQGDLSGNKTNELMKEIFIPLSTSIGVDRLAILNENGKSVNALAIKGERIFTGTNFSVRSWIRQTKSTLAPVFSGGYEGADDKLRVALTYPIVNRETGKYMGLVAALVQTVEFFQHYGNIYNINSQYLAVLDSNSIQLIHPVKRFVGTSFFGSYTQQLTGHNAVLNNLIRTVMLGKPDLAVYDFMNGQRLNTGYPIFEGGKPAFSVFVITPTSTVFSQIDNVIFTERIEMFSLLAGITVAVAIVILLLSKWSQSLEREVKERTKQLDESNLHLEDVKQKLEVHNKAQQEFINVAAHELRTPIQPILSATDVLLPKAIDPHQRDLLAITARNARRLQRLSDNILDVTRIESGTLNLTKERFDLIAEIKGVIKDIQSQNPAAREIQITFSKYDNLKSPVYINADRIRIYQVISNLLTNSIKFTNDGGPISISVEKKEQMVSEKKKEGAIVVSIRDSGIGIPSELMDTLFSKFVSKSNTGTGLGLFISRKIIEAHGGSIWAEDNTDGKGATFSFSIPLSS